MTARDFNRVRRMVVKIGSRVLVDPGNQINTERLRALCDQMAELRRRGIEVMCVSSGAVAAGLEALGHTTRPTTLPALQAAAAIGQARLVELYHASFAEADLPIAQVLLTHPDLQARDRHLNARNTLNHLLEMGVIPIVNENDTVSVEEIRFGDNDRLSALAACLVRADLVVLLSTTDGLCDDLPSRGGSRIAHVARIDDDVRALAGDSESDVSTGGMITKLDAASIATSSGIAAVIADGRMPGVLTRLMDGEDLGTIFDAMDDQPSGRKQWIRYFDHPRGTLHVDAGAARAVCDRGASLLAIGITRIDGEFERGAPVHIVDERDRVIGRGLVNYGSSDLAAILGRASSEIPAILGSAEYESVVHRDNLALMNEHVSGDGAGA